MELTLTKRWLTKLYAALSTAIITALLLGHSLGATACTPADSLYPVALPDTAQLALRSTDSLHAPRNAAHPQPSAYERRRAALAYRWSKLIPNQVTIQYAGSIGLINWGIGWHYGRNHHWETDLLMGFVPRYHSERVHYTFTIKERYVPWHCRFGRRWVLQPLTTGLFFNTISGDDFWKRLPEKYPKHYYGFSTKLRTHIFVGQRVCYRIPRRKRLLHSTAAFYYELSSCDLYIASKATNREYPWRKTLSLALGLRWEI